MTPKEKSVELLYQYISIVNGRDNFDFVLSKAKKCALIAVDEILKVVSFYNDSQAEVIYFKEVKQEIEKL